MLTDAEAEAVRVYHCLSTYSSYASTAREFGVHTNTIREIVKCNTHMGNMAGNRTRGPRPRAISVIGRQKRKTILDMLRIGPKDCNEIREAIGTDPQAYLTEMRKAGKIQLRYLWGLK